MKCHLTELSSYLHYKKIASDAIYAMLLSLDTFIKYNILTTYDCFTYTDTRRQAHK
jgi:hypothetical protein